MRVDKPILGFEGNDRYLSNFWRCTFVYQPAEYGSVLTFHSSEQLYMLSKSHDMDYKDEIMSASTPAECKKIGKRAALRPDWDQVMDAVMLKAVRLKFAQNPHEARALKDTGYAYLEETNNWHDRYWGVCDGEGLNMLGITLMRVRAELSIPHFLDPFRAENQR